MLVKIHHLAIYLVPMNYFLQLISQFLQATRKSYKYEILLFFKNTFIFIQLFLNLFKLV